MKIKAFAIKYETDGQDVDLPTTLEFDVEKDFDLENDLADLISDKTGWLVASCDYEIVKKGSNRTETFCDCCSRKAPTKTVVLKDESGWADYCEDCIKNNPHVRLKAAT